MKEVHGNKLLRISPGSQSSAWRFLKNIPTQPGEGSDQVKVGSVISCLPFLTPKDETLALVLLVSSGRKVQSAELRLCDACDSEVSSGGW